MTDDWIQINCALFQQSADGSAYVPWTDLADTVETWRSEQRFERFFFMRKPPALRLRFNGPALARQLEPVLVGWLEDAEQRNAIRSFRFATYEPEVFLFGGPAGMDIAHDQFDRDSRAVLRYESVSEVGGVEDSRRVAFSLSILQDLFSRVAEDQSELWDIWQRVWHAHGQPALPERHDVAASTSVPEALDVIVQEARAANAQVVARLHAADVARRLTCGPRAWAARIALFHWNRLGLSLDARAALLAGVLQER